MKKHILIAEGDKKVMSLFAKTLNSLGAANKCTWAQTGGQVVEQLKYLAPHFIFLAKDLPDMDAVTLLRLLRDNELLRTTPVIIHGPAADARYAAYLLAQGASGYLALPASMEELIAKIEFIMAADPGTLPCG